MVNDLKWPQVQNRIIMFKEVSGEIMFGIFQKVDKEVIGELY